MPDSVFATQGAVVEFLQARGLKISKSRLNRDYLAGLLVRGDEKGFLEADVLAYAERLRNPPKLGKNDSIDPLREVLDDTRRALRRVLRAIPDMEKVGKTLAAWLDAKGKNIDPLTRGTAQDTLDRIQGLAPAYWEMPDDISTEEAPHASERATPANATPPEYATGASEPATPDEFSALCLDILADGRVDAGEARMLARWLEENPQGDSYAMRQLRKRLDRITREGTFSSRDGKDLFKTLKGLIGGALPEWLRDKPLPGRPRSYNGRPVRETLVLTPEVPGLYDEANDIDRGASFCFTGIFAFGERRDCEAQAAQRGGTVIPRPLKGARCYLVVGNIASPDWAHGCYGRKVELAMRYRDEGAPLEIIPEDVWANALAD